MSLFKPSTWLTKQPPVVEKQVHVSEAKSYSSIVKGSFLESVLTGETITASKAAEFYKNTSSVATAVDMIADAIEQFDPVIEDENGKLITDHEMIRFLKKPNGIDMWQNFIGTIARNYLLTHDVILTSVGNVRRQPLSVWPAQIQDISVMQNAVDRFPQTYLVPIGPVRGSFNRDESKMNDYRFYDGVLKELFHIRGYMSGTDKTRSDSPLQAAANEAKQIIKGKYHNLKLLDNGGRLSLMIAINDEDGITDDEHQERVQRINEQYSGPQNAGKIGVISNAEVSHMKEFGINNKDMDYGNLETLASNAIYLRYKIPLPLVTTKASTFNNVATGVGSFYDGAVLPTADLLFSGLTNFLMPRFNLDPNTTRLTYNPESIGPLKRRKIEEVEVRKKIGVETTNELRSLLPGREPIDGGNILYQNQNLIPAGTDIKTDDNNDT